MTSQRSRARTVRPTPAGGGPPPAGCAPRGRRARSRRGSPAFQRRGPEDGARRQRRAVDQDDLGRLHTTRRPSRGRTTRSRGRCQPAR
jgi:hypothetical protein